MGLGIFRRRHKQKQQEVAVLNTETKTKKAVTKANTQKKQEKKGDK